MLMRSMVGMEAQGTERCLELSDQNWLLFKVYSIYPPENYHIPPGEKENHLQNAIFGGYVSSLEGYL